MSEAASRQRRRAGRPRAGRGWRGPGCVLWPVLAGLAGVTADAGPLPASRVAIAEAAAVSPRPAGATVGACLEAAARHFALPLSLLQALAEVESGGDPRAVSRPNRDGSRDIGLMQINSRWLPRLASWRIDEAALLDPCVSAHVGAWILADNIARLGPVWRAVGAYNARTPSLQLRYAIKVRATMRRLASQGDGGAPSWGMHPP